MTTMFIRMRRLIAMDQFDDTCGIYDVIYRSTFLFLIAMYFWLPLGEEEISGLVVAVAIASFIFLFQDIWNVQSKINYATNAVALSLFVALLSVCIWLSSKEIPHFGDEAGDWYRKYGIALMIGCLGSAIVEEMVFRRYLQTQLQRFLSVNWAILFSAVAFTFAHGFFSFHLFFAGVAYGILASHLGAIHSAILIHTIVNVLGFAQVNLVSAANEEGLSSAVALGGSSAIAQFVSMALLFLFMTGRTLYYRRRH